MPAAPAQQSGSAAERLTAAAALASLDGEGIRPWHLSLEFTLFDEAGKNPSEGTAEIWHADRDSLTKVTYGSATTTQLEHDGKYYGAASDGDVPFLVDELLANVLNPGPSPQDIEKSTPDKRKETFGKTPLDCIMLAQIIQSKTTAPLGLFPTYCLDPASGHLIASYNFGSHTVVRTRVAKFLDHEATMGISLQSGSITLATAKVTALATFTPTTEFEPAPQMQMLPTTLARISSGVISGLKTGGNIPMYPAKDRAAHISGSVVMRAIIGRDGHVHSLQVKSTADADLAIAAIAAVRTWTYKPYLLNGHPTEVDTTIIVNFNLSPG